MSSSSKYLSSQSIAEAAATGALYVAGERLFYKEPVMEKGLQRFGESALSSWVADPILDALSPSVISPEIRSQQDLALHAAVSGLVLASVDSVMKFSSASFMYKLLLQAGSDAVAGYGVGALYQQA